MDETKHLTQPMTQQEKATLFTENFDSFVNFMLRVGTDGGSVQRSTAPMSIAEMEDLYMDSPTARRICDIFPEEMFRAGFTIKGASDSFDNDAFRSAWEGADMDSKLIQMFSWSCLYGAGGLLIGTKTSASFADPMNPAEEVDFVRVLGVPEIQPLYDDAGLTSDAAMSGLPEAWEVKPLWGGTNFQVHNSRLLLDAGKPMPPGKRMATKLPYGMSVLQGLKDKIQRYDECNQWASLILARLQQGVWKSEGLADDCQTDAGFRAVQRRLNLVDSTRSVSNTIAIDTAEEYSLLTGSLAGVTDLLKELRAQLSLYTGIPEVAFSSAITGSLSNSAEGPLQMFWSKTSREQKLRATPIVQRLVSMMTGEEEFTIEWNPLAEETPQQTADRLQKSAQADAAYIAAGAVSVEEVRDTLRQRGDYVLGKDVPVPPRQQQPQSQTQNQPQQTGEQ